MKNETANTRHHRERGQTLIEFAFIVPLILVLLMTIVDFAIAVDRRQVIQHAIREGARQGAVAPEGVDIAQLVADQSQGVLDSTQVDICYVDGASGAPAGAAGSNIRVSLDPPFVYRFSLGAGELLAAFGVDPNSLSVEMKPRAEARMETSLAGVTACP